VAGGNLTFPQQVVLDATGSGQAKLQAGSFAPAQAWCAVNCIVDVSGSPSCTITADGVILDQAGGPQPQLGPVIFSAQQVVLVTVTGGMPGSQVVIHVSGVWDDLLQNVQGAIATLSGGTIGAQQIVGTPFLESNAQAIAPSATYTSAVYPMLGYTGVLVQSIVTLGSLTAMPTVTLQWLDNATPPNVIYQSNWQTQKIIDTVQAWGQNMQIVIANNDAAHTCNVATTLVPISSLPPQKAAALTYKATALNELLGIHNQSCALGSSLYATTAAGLGWSGPATLYVNPNNVAGWPGDGNTQTPPMEAFPDYFFQLAYAPAWSGAGPYTPVGTKKILVEFTHYCPIAVCEVDLIDQPLMMQFTNNANQNAVTPDLSVVAGYR
jgi:hypothetical protein